MAGKGSARRPAAKPDLYQRGYDNIDWGHPKNTDSITLPAVSGDPPGGKEGQDEQAKSAR